jgi:tRNA threonylcarbamoyladenosine modification (KEOPS) complex  Pcc1 subunit
MYESTISINKDVNELERLLEPEQKDLGRSSFIVSKKGKTLSLQVKAEDATAFKTVMNTLAKIFAVWEKSKGIKNES